MNKERIYFNQSPKPTLGVEAELYTVSKATFNLSSKAPVILNTFKNDQGIKTRHFNAILKELELYMSIHKSSNSFPGGIHIEFTSENVTECLGGFQNIDDSTLMNRYETACDPRLNNQQSLELIFKLNDLINERNYDA